MYRFVNTLNDSRPWIEYFRKQAESTSRWQSDPVHSVVVLKSDLKKQGVEDVKKIEVVSEVDQTSKQAIANLTKQIAATKKSGKRQAKPSGGVKKTAKQITNRTKDIFTKYRDSQKNN